MKGTSPLRPTSPELKCTHCGHVAKHPVHESGPHAAVNCVKCRKFIKNISKSTVVFPSSSDGESGVRLPSAIRLMANPRSPTANRDHERDILAGHFLGWDTDATDTEIARAYRFVDRMRKVGGDV